MRIQANRIRVLTKRDTAIQDNCVNMSEITISSSSKAYRKKQRNMSYKESANSGYFAGQVHFRLSILENEKRN